MMEFAPSPAVLSRFRFGYLGYVAVAAAALTVVVALLYRHMAEPQLLAAEWGVIEWSQKVFWLLSIGVTIALFARALVPLNRMAAFWLTIVALGALARECDAQILLNPETIGAWGLRYRMDWWLSRDASIPLRLFWLAVFSVIGASLIVPLVRMKIPFVRLVRRGDVVAGLFLLALLFSFLGFVFDDLLRETTVIPVAVRQLAEETSELIGAGAFFVAMLALLKRHPSVRIAELRR